MSNTRRSYSRDFKNSAVKKVIEHGLSNLKLPTISELMMECDAITLRDFSIQ